MKISLICEKLNILAEYNSSGQRQLENSLLVVPFIVLFSHMVLQLYLDYVLVKSKLQHPHSRATPRAFEFLENVCSNSPLSGPKSCSNAPPPGKLQDYCFNFSVAFIMLLKLCM